MLAAVPELLTNAPFAPTPVPLMVIGSLMLVARGHAFGTWSARTSTVRPSSDTILTISICRRPANSDSCSVSGTVATNVARPSTFTDRSCTRCAAARERSSMALAFHWAASGEGSRERRASTLSAISCFAALQGEGSSSTAREPRSIFQVAR